MQNMYLILLFLSVVILIHCDISAAFNVEELKLVNYEVDIVVSPVEKEESSQSVVHITSKSGQEFQCVLPQLNEDEVSEKEVISERDDDVLQLLNPMKTGPCLTKGKDWWTYEFCFGHFINQYHVEDGHLMEQVYLGFYESDFDWSNETSQDKFKHAKQKYHSQYYTNGTKCDLTGMPRNAEVRIYCEEDAGDYIYRVDEPGTCSYIITVHTSRLCSHPQLKPLPTKKAHMISCNPLLNDMQYSIYLQKLQEEKAVAEEKRNQWLFNQQERLEVMKNENGPAEENAPIEESKTMKKEQLPNNEEFIRNILLQEYDKEIEKLKKSLPPEKFATFKVDIQKRLDKILDQAAKDFGSEFSDETRENQISEITTVLNMLLEKLGKAEQDVVQATRELNKARSVISEVHVSESDGKELEHNAKETEAIEEIGKIINSGQQIQSQSEVLDDDKLQVRIRRLDRKSSDSSGKLHEMDFEQRKKLEQAVKEKLEKAGLDTGGRRIEVKIITAGYYDNEDGRDFQSLTDEETDQFQNMIMALLTGQQEAVQEMKRHKKLEESYKFTWNDEEADSKEN